MLTTGEPMVDHGGNHGSPVDPLLYVCVLSSVAWLRSGKARLRPRTVGVSDDVEAPG